MLKHYDFQEAQKLMPAMTTEKKYQTFVSHNQYGYALASAISLSQNEVTYSIQDLSEPLRTKLYGVIGWIDLTKAELHQINDVRKGIYRVGDGMMQNLLNQILHKQVMQYYNNDVKPA